MAISAWDSAWNKAGQWAQTAVDYLVEKDAVQPVNSLKEAQIPPGSCCVICEHEVFKLDHEEKFVKIKTSYQHDGCVALICQTCYEHPQTNKTTCPCCRNPIAPPNQPPRTPPVPLSLNQRFVQWGRHGLSFGSHIGIDLFLSVVPTTLFAAASAGLLAITVDSSVVHLFLEGPVLGAIAGAALGALAASAAAFAIFHVGNEVRQVRWKNPYANRIITVTLAAVTALVAIKVAHIVGLYLVSQWVAHCVALNQVSSVLDLAWKVIPMTTSLNAGFSSPCVMAAAQISAFGITTGLSLLAILGKRIWQEVPKQWNVANRRAPNAPAHG